MNHNLTWRSVDRIVILSCLALTVWYGALGYLEKPGDRIRGSDSIGYYVYLPSIFMDGDLDLTDDFQALAGKDVFLFPAPNGRAGNPYSIGPAILWTPWFALGHILALITDYPTDGYSPPYQFFVYWGNALYVVIGLLLTVRLLKSFQLSPRAALIGTLSVLLATQLTYYILPKSATSHGLSFATIAAFALVIRKDGISWRAGLLGGLAALIRWQNILFLPVLAAATHINRKGLRVTTEQIRAYWPYAAAAAIAILPQMIVWQLIYERPFLVPQLEGYVDLTRLPVVKILFSARHGLVTWHPWWLVAGAGLFLLARLNRTWAIAVGVCFGLQLYMNGTVLDWWGTWSFGHRRFVNLLPLLAIGAGTFYVNTAQKYKTAIIVALAALGLWNQAFIYQYQRVLIPRSKAPTSTEFFEDKFSLEKVWRAQLAVNTAVQSFRRDDFENFLRFAAEAHKIYPEYRNTLMVNAVASAVEGRWGEAIDDFERWLDIEPESKAARWGLADMRFKLGQVGQAREIVNRLGIGDSDVDQALELGEGTLLTRSFFEQYRRELDQIYTD